MYNLFGDPALETESYASPIITKQSNTQNSVMRVKYLSRNTVSLQVPKAGTYSVWAYSADGKKAVRIATNKRLRTGAQAVRWNGPALSAGVYLITLEGNSGRSIDKFVLME